MLICLFEISLIICICQFGFSASLNHLHVHRTWHICCVSSRDAYLSIWNFMHWIDSYLLVWNFISLSYVLDWLISAGLIFRRTDLYLLIWIFISLFVVTYTCLFENSLLFHMWWTDCYLLVWNFITCYFGFSAGLNYSRA